MKDNTPLEKIRYSLIGRKIYSLQLMYEYCSSTYNNASFKLLCVKPFPTFEEYKWVFDGDQENVSIYDGVKTLEAYIKDVPFYKQETEYVLDSLGVKDLSEDGKRIFYLLFDDKAFSLNKLLKELRRTKTEIVDEILEGKDFPNFKEYKDSFKGDQRLFSIYDGLKILKSYVNDRVYDFDFEEDMEQMVLKSQRQNEKFKAKDSAGLLGVSRLYID